MIPKSSPVEDDEMTFGSYPQEREFPLVVLGETVIMPHMTVPLHVGQSKSFRAMDQAWEDDHNVLLIFVSEAEIENYKNNQPQQFPPIGVIARLMEFIKLPDGTVRIILEGLQRARIRGATQSDPYYRVRCVPIEDEDPTNMEIQALIETVKQQVDEFVDYLGEVPQEAVAFVHRITQPGHLADIVTWSPAFEFKDRLEILNTLDPVERLHKAYLILARRLELLKLRQKIQQDTKEVLDQSQREYFLREQIRVIRRELGEDEDGDDPIDDLRRKIFELDAPEYVREQAIHEFKRLAQQGMNSPESGVIRTYLDWILNLPWSDEEHPEISLTEAQRVLDEDHYGLDKVKERLLEYLAVRKLAGHKMRSPILCFVGPPGVGKTSLGRSIARALGRQFVRTSLGGIRDEAEIRGHRRTYIGAMPGRVIQSIKMAKSRSPIYMLDEIDKVGMDFRGDPTSALLEVLDPEQNHAFSDHYLEIPYDLSKVIFIATANQLDPIPMPLRDRMEVIEIGGYTEEEKLHIALGFLVPKQLEFHGLQPEQLTITEEAILMLIRRYTREAGVRNLERELASLCRKVARKVASVDDQTADRADTDHASKNDEPVTEPVPAARPMPTAATMVSRLVTVSGPSVKTEPLTTAHETSPQQTIFEESSEVKAPTSDKENSSVNVPTSDKDAAAAAAPAEPLMTFTIDADDVVGYLGSPRFSYGLVEEQDEIGVATGVSWTPSGGDILSIEVLPVRGKGTLQLTGHLGDVMKESAQTAMSYARSLADTFGVDSTYFDEHAFHIHVPEGAVPKDGPSAGITLTTALISAMTGKPVRRDVAMTGEVTLRGKVLAIGGLKEKTLAAHRAGIKTFILPKENVKDISDLPERIKEDLNLVPVASMDEVLNVALKPR
ncbi:MAG: endopeptidase La [Chloroflexaceae bacterium]|nr:endopeptidase La [Chloroflexaceae bacterium]